MPATKPDRVAAPGHDSDSSRLRIYAHLEQQDVRSSYRRIAACVMPPIRSARFVPRSPGPRASSIRRRDTLLVEIDVDTR